MAVGISAMPMGQRQRALGLDVLPLAGGGRTVEVFQTGGPYVTGHADQDPQQLAGFTQDLGIRSMVMVPLEVAGARRGVLAVDAAQPEAFSTEDQHFVQAVARWLGLVVHRIEAEEARRSAGMRLGRRQVDEAAVVPVSLPALVQQQGAQGGQAVTAAGAPLPAPPFLAANHDAVIGLFAQPVPNVAPLTTTRAIVRDPLCTGGHAGRHCPRPSARLPYIR